MAEPGRLTVRGGGTRELSTEELAQIQGQIEWLKANGTQAGKYLDSVLASGWDITIVAVDLNAGILAAGTRGDADAHADTRTITIRYDPNRGSSWSTFDPNDRTRVIASGSFDGTDVLAHELGHAYFDSTYIDRYKPADGRAPYPPSEYESKRVQNEITYIKGMPLSEIQKQTSNIPEWDKYIKPRLPKRTVSNGLNPGLTIFVWNSNPDGVDDIAAANQLESLLIMIKVKGKNKL